MAPTIRLATPDDVSQILAIYGPSVRDTPTSFELIPPTMEEMATRIATTLERLPWIVCVEGGQLMGYAYASPYRARPAYRWSAETAIYVHENYRKRGVARTLYTSLFAALTFQGYVNVYAGITLPNPASVALHESMGFEAVGIYRHVGFKLGKWHDVGWWQRDLQELPLDPPEPVPLPSARERPDWMQSLGSGLTHLLI